MLAWFTLSYMIAASCIHVSFVSSVIFILLLCVCMCLPVTWLLYSQSSSLSSQYELSQPLLHGYYSWQWALYVEDPSLCGTQVSRSHQRSVWGTLGCPPFHQKHCAAVPVKVRNVVHSLGELSTRMGEEAMVPRGWQAPGRQASSSWWSHTELVSTPFSESYAWMEELSAGPCSEEFASHHLDLYLWTWVQVRVSWTPYPSN